MLHMGNRLNFLLGSEGIMFSLATRLGVTLLIMNLCIESAFAQIERPDPTLENAEKLELIAHLAASGQLGCGVGRFEYFDHSRNKRTVKCGLDPIHVFGNQITAKSISTFLKGRATANQSQKGPMQGQRRYLIYAVLEVVSDTRDPEFIEDLVSLLNDPNPDIQQNVQMALLRVGEGNPDDREAILNALNTAKWNPNLLPPRICSWTKTGS